MGKKFYEILEKDMINYRTQPFFPLRLFQDGYNQKRTRTQKTGAHLPVPESFLAFVVSKSYLEKTAWK